MHDYSVRVEEEHVDGFKIKTFFDANGDVELTLASDGTTKIIEVPTEATDRQRRTDEFRCLAACVKIEDLTSRLNCILACPVTKRSQVFVF